MTYVLYLCHAKCAQRRIANTPEWNPDKCIAFFPASNINEIEMKLRYEKFSMEVGIASESEDTAGKPLPVDAPTTERLSEFGLGRKLCLYDKEMQKAPIVHFMVSESKDLRYLAHFYTFLFFEDWRHDVHMKRLIRDHIRYSDELQCAAARVVAAIQDHAKKRNPTSNPDGLFDTMHIRRGDFKHFADDDAWLTSEVLLNNTKKELTANGTVFIATDEQDKSFFEPFIQYYDVHFLDDFKHLLSGLSTNYYGSLDQLVASQGEIFFGTKSSTFSAYIYRMRGYHSDKQKLKGHKNGSTESYILAPEKDKNMLQQYAPIHKPFWSREFPVAWQDIEKGSS